MKEISYLLCFIKTMIYESVQDVCSLVICFLNPSFFAWLSFSKLFIYMLKFSMKCHYKFENCGKNKFFSSKTLHPLSKTQNVVEFHFYFQEECQNAALCKFFVFTQFRQCSIYMEYMVIISHDGGGEMTKRVKAIAAEVWVYGLSHQHLCTNP